MIIKRILSKVISVIGLTTKKELKNFQESMPKLFVPPNHYYSPINNKVILKNEYETHISKETPGILLNKDYQFGLLNIFKDYYKTYNYPVHQISGKRYYLDNDYFSYSDAITCSNIILHYKPKRIIEIGSGFSSAMMLDLNESLCENKIELTFIEPFPEERLNELISTNEQNMIVKSFIQNVDLSLFSKLEENDILFVDSSHVSKYNSDVNHIFFEILPLLKKGVIIHFHDIFYPFEYPLEWLKQGRSWNETYLLRSFLIYNHSFEILYFSSYLENLHKDWFSQNMPLCLETNKKIIVDGVESTINTTGQSIFIRKTE